MSLIGIGAGIPFVRGGGLVRAIQALFAASEKGVWYDPSDLSTMFQDSAGTTAAVVGQPVGLLLDKSQGLVLGSELASTILDSTTGWTFVGEATVAGGEIVFNTPPSATASATYNPIVASGKRYKVTFTVTGTGTVNVRLGSGGDSYSNLVAGTYTYHGLAGGGTPTQLSFSSTVSAVNNFVGSVTNISIRELPGYHATQTSTSAKPILQQDAGGHYYLQFDGLDDFMVTPSIDFSGTDKISVFAGARKLSDAAQGAIVELTASTAANNGGFLLAAPDGATATYAFDSKGTVQTDAVGSGFTSPLTSVLTGLGNISGDSAIIRVNGTQADQDTADQGTGNYANAAMYIGMRGGLSIPFNGHLYSLVVRGALSDAAQISAAEAFCNSKTGAY